MRPDPKKRKEKELIKLANEHDKLYRGIKKSGGWVDVEPYQKGWYRYFVIREDIKNRTEIQHIRRMLDIINTTIICRRENFKHFNYKTGQWEPIVQRVNYLSPQQYDKLNEKEKSYFTRTVYVSTKRNPWDKLTEEIRYCFINEFWFVLKIEPRMIDKHWITDGELETKMAEVTHKIQNNNLWPKMMKARSKSYHNGHKDKNTRKDKLIKKGYLDHQVDNLQDDE